MLQSGPMKTISFRSAKRLSGASVSFATVAGCCCEAMIAARRFWHAPTPYTTTNFLPAVNEEACTGCGRCMQICPGGGYEFWFLVDDPPRPKRQKVMLQEDICLGLRHCSRVCRHRGYSPRITAKRVITPWTHPPHHPDGY